MANPLIIFWRWISPRTSGKPKATHSLKGWFPILLTALALFYFTVYYIYTSRVAVNYTVVGFERLTESSPTPPPEINLKITYTDNASSHIGGTHLQRRETLPGITYWVNFHPDTAECQTSALDSNTVIAGHINRFYKSLIPFDSIRDAWQVQIGMAPRDHFFLMEYFHTDKNSTFCELTDDHSSARIANPKEWLQRDKNMLWGTSFLLALKCDSISPIIGRMSNSRIHHHQSVVFLAFDVSQFLEKFSFEGDAKLHYLSFSYGSTIDVSKVNPSPDGFGYDYIEYTDSVKLAQITRNGLEFHVGLPEMENIQIARTFAITTIITLLLTLLIKLLRPKLEPIWDKTIGARSWCLIAILIIIALLIYFSLYHTLKI